MSNIQQESSNAGVYTLMHPSGIAATISEHGALLLNLFISRTNGPALDVVQGYPHFTDYALGNPYHGAVIGRVANRIRDARYVLDGREVQLAANHGDHQLHGGPKGLHNQGWRMEHIDSSSLTMTTTLPDGASGFPGDLKVSLQYALIEDQTIRMEMKATTNAPTLVNLTHHAYFNLDGMAAASIAGHCLKVFSDQFTPGDEELIPTGEIAAVEGTVLDLRQGRLIGDILSSGDPLLSAAGGLDYNFILRKNGDDLVHAARLSSARSGLIMDTWTTQPGLQVYTSNQERSAQPGKHGKPHGIHSAICLECQGFPDAIHHPGFPSWVLRPGQVYHQLIEYRFRESTSPNRSSAGSSPTEEPG